MFDGNNLKYSKQESNGKMITRCSIMLGLMVITAAVTCAIRSSLNWSNVDI